MANPFFDPGEQRAAKVRSLFDRIARRYDLLNDLQSFGLHRYWKRRVIRLAAPREGARALDVCCGTGDLAFALAALGAEVVGLDFSPEMLAVARERSDQTDRKSKIKNQKPTPPLFLCGDAQNLPFPENSFDIVTVGYGLRNLASWETGLREMQRVARPGGRLLILEFGKPDNRVWRAIYFSYLKLFVPLLGLLFAGNAAAYSYILESLKHFPAQRGLEGKMNDLGLDDVQVVTLLKGVMAINYGVKSL